MKTDDLRDVQGEFLATLNHEIRTPLSGILGMTDLLLETSLTDEQKEYAGAARGCAENLLEILNVTLEYSALCANRVRLEETEFSLLDTLQEVLSEFGTRAEAKGLRVVGTFDSSLPEMVLGDSLRLRQILWHLVGNAVKFTRDGQIEIVASVKPTPDKQVMITIEVRDSGIGIASDRLREIFESFRQLENGLSRSHGGLGLGLAVTRKLVDLIHGTIQVTSDLGRGSVFTLQVPLRLPANAEPRSVEINQSRGRVLVIDDNNVAQTIASHALRRQNFEVKCASDGLEALESASVSQFDVILMDLQMPGWNGFETAVRIRALPGYRETPIIAVTANCSEENRVRCANCGMQDFLAKPVRTRDLVQTVEKYLEKEAVAH